MYLNTKWMKEASTALAAGDHVLFSGPIGFDLLEAEEVSHDDIRDAIYDALKAITPEKDGYYSWVREVFETSVVYTEETPSGSKLYRRDYTINEAGEAMLGTATEVEEVTEYIPVGTAPVAESRSVEIVGQVLDLVEVSVRPDNTIPIKVIGPGWGTSAYYPPEVLERDGPSVFTKGTHMHWDHPTEAEEAERPEGSLDSLAGVLASDCWWEDDGVSGPGLYADAEVFSGHRESMNELAPHIGTSIKTSGLGEAGEADGRTGPILTELLRHEHTSVDFVTKAGAGGEVLQLFESARHNRAGRSEPMTDELKTAQTELAEAKAKVEELTPQVELAEADRNELASLRKAKLSEAAKKEADEALKDVDLPEPSKDKIAEEIAEDPPVTEEGELDKAEVSAAADKAAAAEAAYLEQVGESGKIKGMGTTGAVEGEGKKALEESVRRAHPDFTDEQVRIYVDGR